MVKKMAEIKQYYKKMNYEELSLLDSEEFEKLIKNYEKHRCTRGTNKIK